jgi:thiamine-phosphate pyrophosphorylase
MTHLSHRLRLIAIADTGCLEPERLLEVVREVLAAGAPAIQLRAKRDGAGAQVELARALRSATREAGALFFVNDRVDVALAVEADGAHLGDDDLPIAAARTIVPPGFLLGRSVDTPAEARTAARGGADYLGAGPVFPTASKPDAGAVLDAEGIRRIAAAVQLPVVAIGGIEPDNAEPVFAAGAAGVAVIRGVLLAMDPASAARALLVAAERTVRRF